MVGIGPDRIKNLHFYSLLGLSTRKNVKCYPTMTKLRGWGFLVEGVNQ